MNNLKEYNNKRNFDKTNEPKGKKSTANVKLKFVVQHHLARKDHYDFRLENNGVLVSWAIPKGPSYNTKDKRLAINVEDHPLKYRNFEGTIPKGEYGGGTVMIWDYGYYIPKGNFTRDYKKGSIKFELFGKRLKGSWSLVRFDENNWLLIKEKDGVKVYKNIDKFKTSIKTGRTMKEIENNEAIEDNIKITNPDKLIDKVPKVTKLQIVNYYKKVFKRMYPFLENRLISTIRSPDGNTGVCFFKKHLETKSDGIGMKRVGSDNSKKNDYYYIKNINGLIQEVQMNSYEFHIWGSKINNLNHPDIMVFDLDPDESVKLEKVREGVKDLKKILDDINIVSFLKTSGGKGYHVFVPINSIKSWKKLEDVSKNIAKVMESKWPNKYITNMRKSLRKDKIYIDYLRNKKSATSVAPYSLRIRDNITVSMPIKWSELDKVKPNEITIEKAIKRLRRKDPWENFFDINQ